MLQKYVASGDYTDCFLRDIPGVFSIADFVAAFYTTWLFKLERFILHRMLSLPSTDQQARQLAGGDIDRFAAWYVEGRAHDQLLLCDFRDRTRSWLMAVVGTGDDGARTRLYFGSAVIANIDNVSGKQSLGTRYSLLLGLHKLYSRALLYTAARKLTR